MKTYYHVTTKKQAKHILKEYSNISEKEYFIKDVIDKYVYMDEFGVKYQNKKPFGKNIIVKEYPYIYKESKKLEKRISKLESKVEGLINPIKKEVNFWPFPAMEEELTELPEKWCVKLTEENKDLIKKWRKGASFELSNGYYIYYNHGYSKDILYGNTEISSSDFERLVLKEELETGMWYKHKKLLNPLVYYTKNETYGFGIDGCFIYKLPDPSVKSAWRLATTKEVEEALKKEAVKRGFKKGINIKTPNGTEGTCKNGVLRYDKILNYLFIDEYACFVEGKWAEIVQDTHDDVYVKGVWDEFFKKEIDWSIPGQKVIGNQEVIVLTSGDFDLSKEIFSGIIIQKGKGTFSVGYFSKKWDSEQFAIYTNPVTI